MRRVAFRGDISIIERSPENSVWGRGLDSGDVSAVSLSLIDQRGRGPCVDGGFISDCRHPSSISPVSRLERSLGSVRGSQSSPGPESRPETTLTKVEGRSQTRFDPSPGLVTGGLAQVVPSSVVTLADSKFLPSPLDL